MSAQEGYTYSSSTQNSSTKNSGTHNNSTQNSSTFSSSSVGLSKGQFINRAKKGVHSNQVITPGVIRCPSCTPSSSPNPLPLHPAESCWARGAALLGATGRRRGAPPGTRRRSHTPLYRAVHMCMDIHSMVMVIQSNYVLLMGYPTLPHWGWGWPMKPRSVNEAFW